MLFSESVNPFQIFLIEAEASSPEAYVKENGRYPILETTRNESGDTVIVTGDGQGSFLRYTFTE